MNPLLEGAEHAGKTRDHPSGVAELKSESAADPISESVADLKLECPAELTLESVAELRRNPQHSITNCAQACWIAAP
jgi:hypothetical protein